MNTLWQIARYEWRMQWRSLACWLLTILVVAFVVSEVLFIPDTYVTYATSTEPIIRPGGADLIVDRAAQARAALEVASLSTYLAWFFVDRVGLLLALGLGLLSAFVWQRDQQWELVDMLRVRRLAAWQYVGGKYLGLVFTWGSLLLLIIVAVGVRGSWLAPQAGLSFVWADFLLPVVTVIGCTLLYGTALMLLLSLLLRNGVAALLLYLVYWMYSLSGMAAFVHDGTTRLMTYWMLRFDFVNFAPDDYLLLQQRLPELWWNRGLYLGLTVVLLVLTTVVYQRMQAHDGLLRTADRPAPSQLPVWKRWFHQRTSQ